MVYSKEISTKITVDKLPKIIIIYSGYVKLQDWRNWHTHYLEGVAVNRPYEFESRVLHH